MHANPPDHPDQFSAPGVDPAVAAVPQTTVDGIVGDAIAATAAPPAPAGRRARRTQERIQRAHVPQLRHSTPRSRGGGSSSTVKLVAAVLVALLGLGVAAVVSGAVQLTPPGEGPTDVIGGTRNDGTWSYYHDTKYDTNSGGAKWTTDRSRSSDPDEAVLGNTTRWDYDGPYRYGPYGNDGMRRRAEGSDTTDPLYSQPDPLQDVFTQYGGDLDPSGGQPVGTAPSSMTNPYYDPYGGYSNPYANRIRMAYGEGIGRGASYDPNGG
ncbi:MAG: hypothetical protein KDC46_15970 [Thermoleophilia bacterium]|nr:hypothetical protein [Thermoleophilia bacterium]